MIIVCGLVFLLFVVVQLLLRLVVDPPVEIFQVCPPDEEWPKQLLWSVVSNVTHATNTSRPVEN